jgi:hypothetical protein
MCFLVVAANLLQMNQKYEATGDDVSFPVVQGRLQITCEKRLFAFSYLSVVCVCEFHVQILVNSYIWEVD